MPLILFMLFKERLEPLKEEDMLHTLACTRHVRLKLAQLQYHYSFQTN